MKRLIFAILIIFFYCSGPTYADIIWKIRDPHQIALTFDDGPSKPYTEKVLDILKQKKVKATFFVVGDKLGKNRDILNRITSEGHEIGNHTYTHSPITWLNDKKLKDDTETNFNIKEISYAKALYLGLWQSVAMIPGVSRSGATIIGGLLMGLKRETIVKFSFLLAVPTMLAATGYDLLKSYKEFSSNDVLNISIGFIVSFIFALIFIKWLINYVQKNNFIIFGIYRIAIAIIFFLVFFVF
jgi:cation transport ATPase